MSLYEQVATRNNRRFYSPYIFVAAANPGTFDDIQNLWMVLSLVGFNTQLLPENRQVQKKTIQNRNQMDEPPRSPPDLHGRRGDGDHRFGHSRGDRLLHRRLGHRNAPSGPSGEEDAETKQPTFLEVAPGNSLARYKMGTRWYTYIPYIQIYLPVFYLRGHVTMFRRYWVSRVQVAVRTCSIDDSLRFLPRSSRQRRHLDRPDVASRNMLNPRAPTTS